MICMVQIQPRTPVLDLTGYTAPTRQHELDHTDHTDHIVHIDHTDHTDHELYGTDPTQDTCPR